MDKNTEDTQYAFWSLNFDKTTFENIILNCTACGFEITSQHPKVCPNCGAVMVEPLDKRDINGHEICEGDIVRCNIDGVTEKVEGTIRNTGQWWFDNPVGFRWIYDCKRFEVIKGAIPLGKHLHREFENHPRTR